MGKEALWLARGAEVDPVDARAAGGAKGALRRAPEVELPVADEPKAERTPVRRRHLLAHLVAAWADPRTDDRGHEPAAERLHPGRGDPAEQPAPASMQEGERRLAGGGPGARHLPPGGPAAPARA